MANIKLTEQELNTLTELRQQNSAIVSELGQIELVRMQVENRRRNAEAYLNNLRESEDTFFKDLTEKYGNGSIDLDSGEFVPAEEA